MDTDDEAWRRAGLVVRNRRIELGIQRQEELAQRANISLRTVSNIENGRPMTRMGPSVTKIEVALGWEPGSFQAVLAGQQPVVRSTTGSSMRYVSSSHIRSNLDGGTGEVDLSSVSFEDLKAEYDKRIEEMVRLAVEANPDAQ